MFFSVEKIAHHMQEIRKAIHRETCDIPLFRYLEGEYPFELEGAHCPEFDDRHWLIFEVGDTWGGYDRAAWFRTWVRIPPHFKGKKMALRFLVGPRDGGGSTAETLLYVNGFPLQAIDVWHEEAWLPPEIVAQDNIQITLKAWSGVLQVPERRRFKLAQLVWVDEAAERFFYLGDTLLKSVKALSETDLARHQLLQALNQAFTLIDFLKPGSPAFYASIADALASLSAQVDMLKTGKAARPKVVGIGHAHIDLAWLWRLRHTREKAARTFTTALHLMRQYPEYRFMHSSPQLYKLLKDDYPDIYARIKEKIISGQWEITGGMWVEADTNLTSGESLVRQFLLGRQFVKAEFSVEMHTLWLPDVFGYSAALPQIIQKSGLSHFLTSKISWSQFNRFPYDTFHWRGIDGTQILTHFVTTPDEGTSFYTYNGQLTPWEVKGTWEHYRQKEINSELLSLFGWGDGGGGPTREMLESAQVLKDLPGLPQVALGRAEPYFAHLKERLKAKDVPVWDGELYLEYHRGTYTSQAYNKRANRKSEVLYHDAEWLSAAADLLTCQDHYPAQALRLGWELILLNQFHDILPGSSIHAVYEDSRRDYERIHAIGQEALQQAQQAVLERVSTPSETLVVFNSLGWARDGLLELPWTPEMEFKTIRTLSGPAAPVQVSTVAGDKKLLVEVAAIPALGYQSYQVAQAVSGQTISAADAAAAGLFTEQEGKTDSASPIEGKKQYSLVRWQDDQKAPKSNGNGNGTKGHSHPANRNLFRYPPLPQAQPQPGLKQELQVSPTYLENAYYRIELNRQGQITSLWDKRNAREVIAPGGRANLLLAFEDKPMNFDAWDIDIYYQEKQREIGDLVEAQVEEAGPLRGVLRLRWSFADSLITQRLTIYRSAPRIDFRTAVDWHEHQILLKVAFPVAVRATRATYDIQFGNLERPTHWNTSWDVARFETVGHKWADLSEGNYGVSLLNDCKYGYDIKDNVLRLTLIKSGIEPDQQADQGLHEFTYSLLPHAGDWRNSHVVEEAYALNSPLLVGRVPEAQHGTLPVRYCFAELDADHVILETVKQAEDGQAWIVRVYEYKQCRRSAVHLTFGQPIRKAVECNLIEEDERPVSYSSNRLAFPITPYEIKTFKIWF